MSRSVRDPDYRQPTHQRYCWPSLGEPGGGCHRCSPYEDEEGRALVQAIHDRKNQGQRSLTCAKPKKLS